VTIFSEDFEGEILRFVPSGVQGDTYTWSVCIVTCGDMVLVKNANRVNSRERVEELKQYLRERGFKQGYAERKGRVVEYPLS
jgi:hypothetical protein